MQKIILEITGKIKEMGKLSAEREPALEALISLGFSVQKASLALSQIPKEIQKTKEKIKEALKFL
jgi:Holliday junction resolvasome RuvABC DNA-binding subunit